MSASGHFLSINMTGATDKQRRAICKEAAMGLSFKDFHVAIEAARCYSNLPGVVEVEHEHRSIISHPKWVKGMRACPKRVKGMRA